MATLLQAFSHIVKEDRYRDKKLLIVGDGQWRLKLEEIHTNLHLTNNVFFAGKKTGAALLEFIERSEIAIVPSEWEEPMGGVTLELMAAGKCLIVSSNGGHAECAGDAALTFPNGNVGALSHCMKELLENESLREELKIKAYKRVKSFEEQHLTKKYVEVFEQLTAKA